jgi:hypothetical protein
MRKLLRILVTSVASVIVLTLASSMSVGATGQPGAPTNTCGNGGNNTTPGNAANSPGSPFNSNGQAGLVYAGNPNTASLAHSNSTASVSQYDTACVRLSSH